MVSETSFLTPVNGKSRNGKILNFGILKVLCGMQPKIQSLTIGSLFFLTQFPDFNVLSFDFDLSILKTYRLNQSISRQEHILVSVSFE